jgi:hypothetical protein
MVEKCNPIENKPLESQVRCITRGSVNHVSVSEMGDILDPIRCNVIVKLFFCRCVLLKQDGRLVVGFEALNLYDGRLSCTGEYFIRNGTNIKIQVVSFLPGPEPKL